MSWRTYWHYRIKEHPLSVPQKSMIAEPYRLSNDKIEVLFAPHTGEICAIRTHNGQNLMGDFAARAVIIDDKENDTWSHGHFVFDQQIGRFTNPEFNVMEQGDCLVSLRVRQTWKSSILEQIYTLYAGDDRVHVCAHVTLNEPTVSIKLCFDSGMKAPTWIREISGVSPKPSKTDAKCLCFAICS